MADQTQQEGVWTETLNILVGTPCYGGVSHVSFNQSIRSLVATFNQYGVRHQVVEYKNESLIPRGRNFLANIVALDKDYEGREYTHMLFIDADIGFNPADILKAVAQNKDIVGLPYACKDIDWAKVVKAVQGGVTDPELLKRVISRPIINTNGEITSFDVGKPVQFPQLGTGLLLIKKEVFTKFAEDPARKYKLMDGESKNLNRDYAYDYFQIGINPKTRYYDSEDYRFCIDAAALGFDCWLLPYAVTTHTGNYEFFLDMPFQAQQGIAAVGSEAPIEKPKEVSVGSYADYDLLAKADSD